MGTEIGVMQEYPVSPDAEYESGDFEHVPSFTVSSVYDMASEIGKDFEHLIDTYGVESISGIMPKVIGALEQLERLASQAETIEETMSEFKAAIEQLEREKRQKAQDRLKYERDLEAVEERMRAENQELSNVISRLQEENKRLNMTLRHSDSFHSILDRGLPDGEESDEGCSKMTILVEKLQSQLATSDSQILSKSADLDSAWAQIERLTCLNKELRRKIKHSQASTRASAEEKAELQAAIQVHKKEVNTFKAKLKLLEDKQNACKGGKVSEESRPGSSAADTKDVGALYFTAEELKEIIWERNELKTKLSDLTDIIAALKKNEHSRRSAELYNKNKAMTELRQRKSANSMLLSLLFRDIDGGTRSKEEEAAVQGPLPFEPEDAPWRRSESGIRSFFRKLFGSTEAPFGFLQ